MNVARDIAGFTLPFAVGVIAATYLGSAFSWSSLHIQASVSLILTVPAVFFLIHPVHRNSHTGLLVTSIVVAATGCGLITGYTCMMTSISDPHPHSHIQELISAMAAGMKSVIHAVPFEDSSTNGIIAALITGDRSGIPPETTSAFRESGASHILALSGLHLGIIYSLISGILSLAGSSHAAKIIRSISIIVICGLYTAATGAGASITRAFLFILIGESATLTGRYRSTGSILMTSLFVQLLFYPEDGRNIGFQLSYAAMAGIAFIYPWLRRLWPEDLNGPMQWIWNSAAMSTACQITTGPLAYCYFGTFPQYFLLTNMFALPLTGLLIPMGLLTSALNAFGICPGVLVQATERVTECMTFILSTIASM